MIRHKTIKRILTKIVSPSAWKISCANILINVLPDDVLSSYMRPYIAKIFRLECGIKTRLRKSCYYGNCSNISLGSQCCVNREVFFDAYDKIIIGSNVGIAFRVVFITSTHASLDKDKRTGDVKGVPITIEDGVWIGAAAVIGPGVTIGCGSIVSAGAVVMRSMPPHSLIAGNPARVIKKLDNNDLYDDNTRLYFNRKSNELTE